ncbi:MAG: hypothetical protein GY873_15460 [Bosea sp.]|uniref:hypothetical protein n=1 Tax=Bosea sp. (in: a-proteobacteria) TaxID=1871050 RepID=UPI0023A23A63|nr:hypothetical protein [Bosea sp. (in: a-proteobacteria)]MCP4735581.1 hypothetical protein [Bosea sp. (in: a-proteobacteria)]
MSVFDVQAESETPTRIEFRGNESRWDALFHLGVGGWALAYSIPMGGLEAIVGGFFGALFLLFAFGQAFRDLDRSIHLVLDAEGITAPSVFVRKVPWDAVQSYSFDPNWDVKAVLVHLPEPSRFEPKVTDPLAGWPVTWYGFRLSLDGVACSYEEIEAAFRRFAPQIRKV